LWSFSLIGPKSLHGIFNLLNRGSAQAFVKSLRSPNVVQAQLLRTYLTRAKSHSDHYLSKRLKSCTNFNYKQFSQEIPLTTYAELSDVIAEDRLQGTSRLAKNVLRYQPTSGSNSARKWIPYTLDLIKEFDRASGPWLADIYETLSGVAGGPHYWSLSWLPNELRDASGSNDDAELFPTIKKYLVSQIFCVPKKVQMAENMGHCLFATACYILASKELRLMSIWSPTFLLTLLELITLRKDEIITTLTTGLWPFSDRGLVGVSAPVARGAARILKEHHSLQWTAELSQELWPKLALISVWDSSYSKIWTRRLKEIFGHCRFQGKGIWTTEAAVTIPFRDNYPLAINSHFFEFRCLNSGDILRADELQVGQDVQPIVTTGNGIMRYQISDHCKVTGYLDRTPCLEFLGRLEGTDLVGEKMSQATVAECIEQLPSHLHAVTVFAVSGGNITRPYYLLLLEDCKDQCLNEASEIFETGLCRSMHYSLARQLNQLGRLRTATASNSLEFIEKYCHASEISLGDFKVDPLKYWKAEILPEKFLGIANEHTVSW
jgi:hypothetical protein